VQQVGDHQEGLGQIQGAVAGSPLRHELVERVEGQLGDARAGVLLRLGDVARHLLAHPVGARVTIVVGGAQQAAAGVEEPVVDGPGVDADARRSRAIPVPRDA